MTRCCFCKGLIDEGLLSGFWGTEEKAKPICLKCMKRILDSTQTNRGTRTRIEKWLKEENIAFNEINEPNHVFHFALKDFTPLKMQIEVFQEKNSPDIIIGFMTFLSKDLTFRIYRFSQEEKEEFKRNVDEFLSSLRVDYRTGIRVGHEIVSEKGHYGAKYFIKTEEQECNKGKFLKILDLTKTTVVRSDEFLNQTLRN